MIEHECRAGNPSGQLAGDGLALLLANHVLDDQLLGGSPRGDAARETARGLAGWRLRRALELIEERLADDLTLAELAEAVRLHPVYFVRAFKAAIGATPHRYLLERRIERAKALLALPDTEIVQVAAACGFSSQSHLSSWFRRLTGASPKRWRDERAGIG